ncbi:hypothetical protein RclHR1_17550001 [Rhizophagus clarus]|uniref:Uncharacterized protein n=1 Tax=Rhizophagus clarus TaxID=94130 RepID=A0A2Z6QZ14_9GLOM|nr:hypothetical protein RclHR1_17550001 [Rhizophagus clarus]GES83609.1 hypothetical protein RCL_jg19884.t1 [Rhizophagus clarus]
MEEVIKNTFENPVVLSVDKVTTGVKSVVNFLNSYQRTVHSSEFQSVDGFLQTQVNETLQIGRRFRDVTEKSTEINLQMARYSGRVSDYIKFIINDKISGDDFSDAMKHLLDNANRIYTQTLEIKEAYNKISEDLQIIYSVCELKCEDLDKQKKQMVKRAENKEIKEHKNEKRAIIFGVAGSAATVVFPPAAIFFGCIVTIETYNAKKYGKQAIEAREKGNNLQNSLDAIRSFQSVIGDIRYIVDIIETFWKNQVANVQELANSAKDCENDVKMNPMDGGRIVKQWEKVENQFNAYNFAVSKELKNYLMVA